MNATDGLGALEMRQVGIERRQRQGNTNVRISTVASKPRLCHRYLVLYYADEMQ